MVDEVEWWKQWWAILGAIVLAVGITLAVLRAFGVGDSDRRSVPDGLERYDSWACSSLERELFDVANTRNEPGTLDYLEYLLEQKGC